MKSPATIIGVGMVVLVGLVVGFGVWCLLAWLTTLFWGMGIVPFGAPPLTFWQAFGLIGLLGVATPLRVRLHK